MSSSRSPCKESVSSEEPWLLQLILPIRAFAQRLVQFRLWQLRSVSGQTACQSGQRFRSHYSFAQLRISHKLTCPRDRSLESVFRGSPHESKDLRATLSRGSRNWNKARLSWVDCLFLDGWHHVILWKKCQKRCHLESRLLELMT